MSEPRRLYQITVDGELWQVRVRGDGHYDFTWLTGVAPNYGFTARAVGSGGTLSDQAIEASVREFMSNVNPQTGYLD